MLNNVTNSINMNVDHNVNKISVLTTDENKRSKEKIMSQIFQSVTELIGGTPLLEVHHIMETHRLNARILVKLEYFNPAGSVKDRVA